MLKLMCMRGVPGSGKSTRAHEIKKEHEAAGWKVHIFSTDDFWGPNYEFVPAKIREAHLWNQNRAMLAMIEAYADLSNDTLIIIDNTNVCAWEMGPYVRPATLLGFEVEIVEPTTEWAFDAVLCASKTLHGVPLETIQAMLARWDRDVTAEKALTALAPWEQPKPPAPPVEPTPAAALTAAP